LLSVLKKKKASGHTNYVPFSEKYDFPFDDANISNYYSIDVFPSNQNMKGNFVIIRNKRTNACFIGNSQVNKTNFLKTDDALPIGYDASYYFTPRDSINFYMPEKRYNNYIESRKYYWQIIEDKKLFSEIKKYDIYNTYINFPGQTKSVEINKDKVVSISRDILIKTIPPAKRIYTTFLIFGDINKNAIQDCYTFSVSNGELKSYKLYELTETGVTQLQPAESFYKTISETAMFKKIQEISRNPINIEPEF
jgi:hypothetical protein